MTNRSTSPNSCCVCYLLPELFLSTLGWYNSSAFNQVSCPCHDRWESNRTHTRPPDENGRLWTGKSDRQRGVWRSPVGKHSSDWRSKTFFSFFIGIYRIHLIMSGINPVASFGKTSHGSNQQLAGFMKFHPFHAHWNTVRCHLMLCNPNLAAYEKLHHKSTSPVPLYRWGTKLLRRSTPWSCWASLRWSSGRIRLSSGRRGT